MKEQMPENLPERREKESIAEDVRFSSDAMDKVSDALSRYAIVPTPSSMINAQELAAEVDEEIAKILSEVDVVDSHFDDLNLKDDQGVADGAILTAAKAKGLASQVEDADAKTRLEEFKNRVLAGTGKLLASKKALAGASAGILALVMTSCGGQGEAVGAGSAEVPTATQPRTGEVVEIPTEEPTKIPATPTEAPTETQEPTATPEVEQREVGLISPFQELSDLVTEEMLEPLEEGEISRLSGADGEPLRFGYLEEYEETTTEGGPVFSYISGIYRGFVSLPEWGVYCIVFEIPYEDGNSQYILLRAGRPDNPGNYENISIVGETIEDRSRKSIPYSLFTPALMNPDLVGEQMVVATLKSDPNEFSERDEELYQQTMRAIEEQQVVDRRADSGDFYTPTVQRLWVRPGILPVP